MANVFDQFDAPAAAPQRGNPFDQFDAPPQQAAQPKSQDKVGMGEAIVRGIKDQPIIGPLITRAEAAKNALVASRHPDEADISHADTFGQRYAEDLAAEQARDQAAYAQHPIASTAASLGAGLGLGGAVTKLPMGARLLGLVGRNLPEKMFAGATSGAAINAIDASLRGQDPGTAATIGGIVGGLVPPTGRLVGAAVDAIGNRIQRPAQQALAERAAGDVMAARGATPTAETLTEGGPLSTQSLRDVRKASADAIDSNGAQISPDYVNSQIGKIVQGLESDNFRPADQPGVFARMARLFSNGGQTTTAPDTAEGMTRFFHGGDGFATQDLNEARARAQGAPISYLDVPSNGPTAQMAGGANVFQLPESMAARLQPFETTEPPPPVKFGDIQATLMKMNDIIRKNPGTSKAAAAGQAKDGLKSLLEGISQNDVVAGNPTEALRALQDFNAHYAISERAKMYEEAIEKAQRQAESSGIGGNFENALRQQFKNLRNNKRAMLGVPADEKAVIDQVIAGTPIQNIARMAGGFSPFKGTFGNMFGVGEIMAGQGANVVSAMLAGHLGKATAERIARSNAARLSAMARAKAPASQEVQRRLSPPYSLAARLAPFGPGGFIAANDATRDVRQ